MTRRIKYATGSVCVNSIQMNSPYASRAYTTHAKYLNFIPLFSFVCAIRILARPKYTHRGKSHNKNKCVIGINDTRVCLVLFFFLCKIFIFFLKKCPCLILMLLMHAMGEIGAAARRGGAAQYHLGGAICFVCVFFFIGAWRPNKARMDFYRICVRVYEFE